MSVRANAIEPEQALQLLRRQRMQNIGLAIAGLVLVGVIGLSFVALAYSGEFEAAAPSEQLP